MIYIWRVPSRSTAWWDFFDCFAGRYV